MPALTGLVWYVSDLHPSRPVDGEGRIIFGDPGITACSSHISRQLPRRPVDEVGASVENRVGDVLMKTRFGHDPNDVIFGDSGEPADRSA